MLLLVLLAVPLIASVPLHKEIVRAQPNSTFDEHLARGSMYVVVSASYAQKPQRCMTNTQLGEVDKIVEVPCDFLDSDVCHAYTGISHSEKAIFVAFRGTVGTTQLIVEFAETIFAEMSDFASGGKTAKYFDNAFTLLWTGGIKESIQRLLRENPDYKVWVTGHSLGATLASLCASYMSYTQVVPPSQLMLYTYGQPRTGDRAYAQAEEALVPNTFRITHDRDALVHVPFTFMNYYHHPTEIYYANNMSIGAPYTTCTVSESLQCSDGHPDLSVNDHFMYYGKHVSVYGESGCR